MIHSAERILGWRLAASAFLQVAGFLWALGFHRIKQEWYCIGPPAHPRPDR